MPRTAIIEHARKYLGVTETGLANRGSVVDRFLETAGTEKGQPWCAAFIYTVCREAGYKPAVRYPASCRSWIAWAVEHQALLVKPAPGDLVVFDFDADGSKDDHIGVVEKLISFGPVVTLATIEGNTPGTGGRRDGVYRRRRVMRRSRLAFIDATR